MIQDLLYLERVEQAETLLKPHRIEVLRQLAEPRSCTEVAARLDQTQQRVYYHVKRLVEHGIVTQVAERRVRGINEGVYQATARAYWLSPASSAGSASASTATRPASATSSTSWRRSSPTSPPSTAGQPNPSARRSCRHSASPARSGCGRTSAPSSWPT
ncbi:ArsR/SmtB family transcription factor [Dactylosporangium cerinum]